MPVSLGFMEFSNVLIAWYLQNKRDLPWRHTDNPYLIWLSEIMLQQTRVAQGLPYYLRFVDAFPTVFDLAYANEEQVLKLWQGLGYYSRARNLHKAAKYVANELNGVFPNSYKELMHLPGVGSYTAAAISSFAYGEPVAVVDGNVYRVLARYFDIDTDIASSGGKQEFQDLAQRLMPNDRAALFNQAMMEFGALQCVPKSPDCSICVFNDSCAALQKGKVSMLPVKRKKAKAKNRYFNYLVVEDDFKNTIVQKREEQGIWQNLYEFPLVESLESISEPNVEYLKLDSNKLSIYELDHLAVIHKLSHQHLHIKFWKLKFKGKIENGVNLDDLEELPFPIVLYNFIEKHW